MSLFYKPEKLNYLGNKRNKLFLGFEIEVEASRDKSLNQLAEQLKLVNPDIYVYPEGTVDYGFEIITHPMSFMYFRNKFNLDSICSLPVTCKNSCGMHVHLSRTGFKNEKSLDNFIKFFYNNKDFIFQISRRTQDSFDNWSRFSNYIQDQINRNTEKLDKNNCASKSFCVDTYHKNTIEVRIFKGSIHPRIISRNIEFCVSVNRFVHNRVSQSLDSYKKYVSKFSWKYPAIHAYLKGERVNTKSGLIIKDTNAKDT